MFHSFFCDFLTCGADGSYTVSEIQTVSEITIFSKPSKRRAYFHASGDKHGKCPHDARLHMRSASASHRGQMTARDAATERWRGLRDCIRRCRPAARSVQCRPWSPKWPGRRSSSMGRGGRRRWSTRSVFSGSWDGEQLAAVSWSESRKKGALLLLLGPARAATAGAGRLCCCCGRQPLVLLGSGGAAAVETGRRCCCWGRAALLLQGTGGAAATRDGGAAREIDW